MKLSGAKILLECLKILGVDTIFGYPGGAVLPIYDALYDEKEIKHILTSHEQGAAHAADGYARVTGKPGVVIATSGPGATNTVTGIATAYSDSVPMVVVTGQVSRNLIGTSAFQEVDIVGITKPITKKNYLVKNVEDLPGIVQEAFKIANEGRKGPVLIDIPKDIQTSEIECGKELLHMGREVALTQYEDFDDKFKEYLQDAVNLINSSERPIIYAGGGVISSGANKELIEFAEKIKSPVTCTLMGLGAFPGNHKYYTGMCGMHGTRCSNYAITKSDLLIAIGARFSDRVVSKADGFAPGAKIIHIDIDEHEIGKNKKVDVALKGDVKRVLTALIKLVKEKRENNWNCKIQEWKEKYKLKYKKDGKLSGQFVMDKLNEIAEGKCTICTEVGQNQIWAAQYNRFLEPRTFLTSGGLGTMGYGLGAAIGAYFGNPKRKVINVAGDGSFKMNCEELATISRYRIPIVELVLNNNALGMVRQWQEMFYHGRFSCTLYGKDVDFVKLGEAYGIKSFRVDEAEKLEEVLRYALNLDEPTIIECTIAPVEKVFPIVPPGEVIDRMITA